MPSRIYDNFSPDQISVSNSHSLCIDNGELIGWGSPAKDKLEFPKDIAKCVKVSCGYSHTAMITSNGRLFSVGNSNGGKLSNSIDANFTDVKCSRNYTAALWKKDATVLMVFGDQTPYRALPSSLYCRKTASSGAFSISDISQFDISDDGVIVIATEDCLLYRIHHSQQSIGVSESNVVSILNRFEGNVAFYLTDEREAYRIFNNENGELAREQVRIDCSSIFNGNKYYGCATRKSLAMFGDHFGYIKLPVGWSIRNVVGGNNGYALTVSDISGDFHTILVGDNTKNKELVIGTLDFRECPRIKTADTSVDFLVYDVRENKERIKVTSSTTFQVVDGNHECKPCGFRFTANISTCPLCKCGCE